MSGSTGRDELADAQSPRAVKDRELLLCFRLLAEGRLSALSEIYDILAAGLYGYLRGMLGAAEDAEDALQEVFAKLAEHRRKLVRVEYPRAYVFAVARNEALRLIKFKKRVTFEDNEHMLFAPAAPFPGERRALAPEEAQAAMVTLPPLQREVVILKIYEGFTFDEIGRLTGVSPNTAASRYRYGLAKLAGSLRKYKGSA
ncbi:MAG: RNA polymerase sigma factor [Planctomycetota bacterium]